MGGWTLVELPRALPVPPVLLLLIILFVMAMYVEAIGPTQNVSSLSSSSKGNGSVCKMTIDGTDCRIWDPMPFSPKWYSHKFKCPGLRYKVGLCI
jgi:hypothetical protein